MIGIDIQCCKSNKNHYICGVNTPTMSEDRINNLENRIDSLEVKIDKIISTLKQLAPAIDGNFKEIKDKLESLEVKVDSLDVNTDKNFKEVKWELQKIQDVTRYADEYLNTPSAGQA